ncbi:SDR family NAD(P)-dependent oxidoreductase [Paenibacillus roseipurpureus]|uniref:SDR family NAD(P)-dependent oxidoreductase n=1 Tax=Paenibacillus roseopurpureus TaxID=2918901 RepID=A0AA96RML5_9BACL|nr:SDR family NAD(P)-dependent oxidoreductase [Paenibacillus sp. MBLB1832]WNR44407.1 SDR family NAD(P)-dependent oxidoreductase [Paenibacillus sp. MBLB1832]
MKYIVITGASSGIGYETALAFAARGKNLVLAARRQENMEELRSRIEEQYPEVKVIVQAVDLSVAENAYAFYEKLKNYDIETWINNAGFGNFATVGEQKLDKIQQMLHLNIEALTILSSLYVRDYASKQGTQLINISSGGGYTVIATAVTYCASKFYVSAFTEGLALELKANGSPMVAKVLAPAATETEFVLRSRDIDQFEYKGAVPKFHTAKEMAGFLLELYDSDKVVGIVDGRTYEFHLKDPIFPHAAMMRS